ncbi:MAG: MarR family transcriptional regulator [Balneola sp.]|nr:MAG: MarR family transcriptional regulator [Balneola sp.]
MYSMTPFIKDLGVYSLAIRLKQLHETMVHSARSLYKSLDLDIEPNWHLIFKLLQEHEELSVTEIAEAIQFSHPSVISIIGKMKERGFLLTRSDPSDSRRQLISLSEAAKEKLPEFEKVWDASAVVIEEMLPKDVDFYQILDSMGEYFMEESYELRTLKQLSNDQK